MKFIDDVLIGLVGRPILILLKWCRWPFLLGGLFFNTVAIYDPVTKIEIANHTYIPLLIGFILFCIGLTVKRYDENYKDFLSITTQGKQ